MKKLLSLLIIIVPFFCQARIWSMSPTGNDNNTGTLASPFLTIAKMVLVMSAGDTGYVRGGTYTPTMDGNTDVHFPIRNKNGTASAYINIWTYPNEVAIFDMFSLTTINENPFSTGIISCSYIYLKGKMIFKNFRQVSSGLGISRGMTIDNSNRCKVENIEIMNMGGTGMIFENSNDNLILNCSSHNNGDGLSRDNSSMPIGSDKWDNSDAFSATSNSALPPNTSTRDTFRFCTGYLNSDDNWDFFGSRGIFVLEGCLASGAGILPWGTSSLQVNPATMTPYDPSIWFYNPAYWSAGAGSVSGEGFKLGEAEFATTEVLHYLNNCVSFENRGTGFASNSLNAKTGVHQLHNCIAYGNANDGFSFGAGWCAGTNQRFKNNWSWNNNLSAFGADWVYDGNNSSQISNNVWNTFYNGINYGNLKPPITINAADFISLSSAGANNRALDGTLANTNFLKLVANSDLRNAGTNVGLPYCDSNPDIGAYEYCGLPTVSLGTDRVITLPTNSTSFTPTTTGGTSFQWIKYSGGTAVISSPNTANTNIGSLVAGIYGFSLTVTNSTGSVTDSVLVTVNAPNTPPTCSAGTTPITITLPVNSFSLSGSGASTAGNTVSFLWGFTLGTGTIGNNTSQNTTATISTAGNYTVSLLVTDNSNGLTCTSSKSITVNPALIIPTANAGSNQQITLPINSVSLSGSGSGGTINSYLWTKLSGVNGTFSAATSANTNFNGLSQGVYLVQLRVGNTDGNFGYDTVQITVNAALVLPTANAGINSTITLPINTVALNGVGTGTGITTLWTKLASSPATGTIVNAASQIASAINLVQGVYNFEFKVTDNIGNIARDTVQVMVNAALQFPTSNAGSDQSITLPVSSVNLIGSGTAPGATVIGYLWEKLNGVGGTFGDATLASTTFSGLTIGVYVLRLRVTSSNTLVAYDTMQIFVAPAIVAPTVNAGSDKVIQLPINSAALNGSGTGTNITYLWTKLASSPTGGAIANNTIPVTSVSNLTVGNYQYELKVTDINNTVVRDTMSIQVLAAFVPPIVTVTPESQTIVLPTNSTLVSGSAIISNGSTPTYLWQKLSGSPIGGTITSPTSATTGITALQKGIYQFSLTATDSSGMTGSDTLEIIVTDEPSPLKGFKFIQGMIINGKANLNFGYVGANTGNKFTVQKLFLWIFWSSTGSIAAKTGTSDYRFIDNSTNNSNIYRVKYANDTSDNLVLKKK